MEITDILLFASHQPNTSPEGGGFPLRLNAARLDAALEATLHTWKREDRQVVAQLQALRQHLLTQQQPRANIGKRAENPVAAAAPVISNKKQKRA